MRPIRIEIEGFASFRDLVEIDFSDAELFVLSGPTGSGKSSVIDAMTFALYGAVPRHGKHATSAIVSKGMNRARVRLDFLIDGTEYTAVRAAKVLSTGSATTSEARLECADEVLAENARELTDAVEKLVGLSFDHFTQCVVLPQGAFQDFLKATPANRQDMLVQLLDLGIYDQIKRAASDRSTRAEAKANALSVILDQQFGHVSADAIVEAKARAGEIGELAKSLRKKRQDHENRSRAAREAAEAVEQLATRIGAVSKVAVPDGVDELTDRIEKGEQALAAAQEERARADQALDAADAKKNELGEKSARESILEKHAKHAQLAGSVAELEKNLGEAESDKLAVDQAIEAVQEAHIHATQNLTEARERNAAAAIASSLSVGEPCPVCLQEVRELPEHETDFDFEVLENAVTVSESELGRARIEATRAATGVASARGVLDSARKQVTELAEELEGSAEPEQLRTEIGEIEKAQEAWSASRKARDQAVRELEEARKEVDRLHEARDEAWTAFEAAREEVIEIKPPKKKSDNLTASWAALAEWADDKTKELEQELEEAEKRQQETQTSESELLGEVRAELRDAGIEFPKGQNPFDAADEASAEAKTALKQLEQDLATSREKQKELEDLQAQQRTAEALSQLLRADQFEKWLLGRALRSLTASATKILNELTSGAYSLSVGDDNNFAVVDHLNANEVRSAATLSGGETFLTSLSLALALADQVAQLAAKGSTKLDALFLDEGFGTLDPETLDVVATTLEELGAQGRMIGVVTHVRELADRLPVRFDLRKEGNVSTVTRAV